MKLHVTIHETIEVPDGTTVSITPIGACNGFILPSGEKVRPWTTFEIEEDGSACDLDEDEMQALGITTMIDMELQVETDD